MLYNYITFQRMQLKNRSLYLDSSNDQKVDIPVFWNGRSSSYPKPVKLTQVAIYSPQMQPWSVSLGVSCSYANSLHITSTKINIMKTLFDF